MAALKDTVLKMKARALADKTKASLADQKRNQPQRVAPGPTTSTEDAMPNLANVINQVATQNVPKTGQTPPRLTNMASVATITYGNTTNGMTNGEPQIQIDNVMTLAAPTNLVGYQIPQLLPASFSHSPTTTYSLNGEIF